MAPNLALAVFGGAAPANLGIALDVRGPILSTANSCASGAVALGEALGDLRDGRIDAAIAGGCEIPLSPLAFGAFDIIRALSAGHNDEPGTAERPFDRGRDGFVMGEGAALLVLEAAEVAVARGAVPYAELLGYGATSDAHHMVQPRADGTEAARAATIALDDAGVDPDEIDYVSAHASSTPIGDVAEARAISLALGERAATVPVSGTKALYGHPLGRVGRDRGRDLRADDPRRLGAGLGQPGRAGPEIGGAAARAAPRRAAMDATGGCCRPRSGSAASTPRSSSAPSRADDRPRAQRGQRADRAIAADARRRRRSAAAAAGTGVRLAGRSSRGPSRSRRIQTKAPSPTSATGRRRSPARRDPEDRREPAHDRPADRGRAGEDRRVDAHHPAAEPVGDGELDRRVRRRHHRDRRRRRRRTSAAARSRRSATTPRTTSPTPEDERAVGIRRTRALPPKASHSAATSEPTPGRGHQEAVAGRRRRRGRPRRAAG